VIRVRLEIEVECNQAERLEEVTGPLGALLDPLETDPRFRLELVRFCLVREGD
jgi:hypothetical protein